jgi:hypothetical protein
MEKKWSSGGGKCHFGEQNGLYIINKVIFSQAGKHTLQSHIVGSGILSVKQRSTVKHPARNAPQAVGSQVQTKLENSSPGKQIPVDTKSHFGNSSKGK